MATNRILVGMLLLFGAISSGVSAADKPAPQAIDGNIKWVFDYADGKRLSRDTGKPMFVVFRCER